MTKVLIIDDSQEQLNTACLVAHKKGWEFVQCHTSYCPAEIWATEMINVDGVMTDLMWEYKPYGKSHGLKPIGLLVVIHALTLGKPVVVCTNAKDNDGGHHGEALSWIHDGYLYGGVCNFLPNLQRFGWVEDKNWDRAAESLASKLVKKNG